MQVRRWAALLIGAAALIALGAGTAGGQAVYVPNAYDKTAIDPNPGAFGVALQPITTRCGWTGAAETNPDNSMAYAEIIPHDVSSVATGSSVTTFTLTGSNNSLVNGAQLAFAGLGGQWAALNATAIWSSTITSVTTGASVTTFTLAAAPANPLATGQIVSFSNLRNEWSAMDGVSYAITQTSTTSFTIALASSGYAHSWADSQPIGATLVGVLNLFAMTVAGGVSTSFTIPYNSSGITDTFSTDEPSAAYALATFDNNTYAFWFPAAVDCTDLTLVYANFGQDPNYNSYPGYESPPFSLTNVGGPIVIDASVKYNGSYYPMTFGGGRAAAQIDAGATAKSDGLPLYIHKATATDCWVFTHVLCPPGVSYPLGFYAIENAHTEGLAAGDITAAGGAVSTQGCNWPGLYHPSLILGVSATRQRVTVVEAGDSLLEGHAGYEQDGSGQGTLSDDYFDFVTLALNDYNAANLGSANVGIGAVKVARTGDKAQLWATDARSLRRRQFAGYGTHVVLRYGLNDMTGSGTAAAGGSAAAPSSTSVLGYLETIAGYHHLRNQLVYATTFQPYCQTTDDFVTCSNQIPGSPMNSLSASVSSTTPLSMSSHGMIVGDEFEVGASASPTGSPCVSITDGTGGGGTWSTLNGVWFVTSATGGTGAFGFSATQGGAAKSTSGYTGAAGAMGALNMQRLSTLSVPITAITNDGSGHMELAVTGHGLSTGAMIIVRGCGDSAQAGSNSFWAANGEWTVTTIDANHISLQGSVYPSGSPVFETGFANNIGWLHGAAIAGETEPAAVIVYPCWNERRNLLNFCLRSYKGLALPFDGVFDIAAEAEVNSSDALTLYGNYWAVGSASTFTVSSATQASPCVLTTSVSHGLSVGNVINITGAAGLWAGLNELFTVTTVPSGTTLTVTPVYGGTGAFSSASLGALSGSPVMRVETISTVGAAAKHVTYEGVHFGADGHLMGSEAINVGTMAIR